MGRGRSQINAIVVCGFSRSGTTLLYNMLRHSVKNYRTFGHETPCQGVDKHDKVITKRPMDVLQENDRHKILVMRDPRAIITSKHWSDPERYFVDAYRTITGHPGVVQTWEAFKQRKGFVVRYEELVSDPGRIQRELGRHFGLRYKAKFEDFHTGEIPRRLERALNGIRPLDSGHDWRDHMPRIEQQFSDHEELHDVLIEMGYESDRQWLLGAKQRPQPHNTAG